MALGASLLYAAQILNESIFNSIQHTFYFVTLVTKKKQRPLTSNLIYSIEQIQQTVEDAVQKWENLQEYARQQLMAIGVSAVKWGAR